MSNEVDVYMCDEVRAIRELHDYLFDDGFRMQPVKDQLAQQAERIVDAHQSGDPVVSTHIKCWHPKLVGRSAEEIMSQPFTLSDARETIAREYGFDDWSLVETRGEHPPDEPFETAVDLLLTGDIPGLGDHLQRHPGLTTARSAYGHQATLLHYVGSNGVETYRQVVPMNLAEIAQLLLDNGADVNAEANIYGGGCTTIALLTSSTHPSDAGILDVVGRVLLDGGANT